MFCFLIDGCLLFVVCIVVFLNCHLLCVVCICGLLIVVCSI